MANFEIILPESFEVSRGKDADEATVAVDVTALTPDLVAKLALHGLKQKVADAAAGAKAFAEENNMTVADAASNLMQKVVDRLHEGDWGAERGAGAGVSLGYGAAVDAAIISIMRPAVKGADKAWYKDAKEADRKARCAEAFEGLSDEQQAGIVRTAEARVAAAKAEAEAVKALEIKIDL